MGWISVSTLNGTEVRRPLITAEIDDGVFEKKVFNEVSQRPALWLVLINVFISYVLEGRAPSTCWGGNEGWCWHKMGNTNWLQKWQNGGLSWAVFQAIVACKVGKKPIMLEPGKWLKWFMRYVYILLGGSDVINVLWSKETDITLIGWGPLAQFMHQKWFSPVFPVQWLRSLRTWARE